MKFFLLFMAVAAASVAGPGWADTTYCYDPARRMTTATPADRCEGKVIGAAEAARIEEKRKAYLRRAMKTPPADPDKARLRSTGSGFFVSRDGHVVTNLHVVNSCRKLTVLAHDGEAVSATLIAAAAAHDLALLKADTQPKNFAILATVAPTPGAPVAIVGFPVQKLPRRQPLTVQGEVLGEQVLSNGGTVLSLNAQVWQGSSGSAVIDRQGKVIGVIFAKANIPAIYQEYGEKIDDRAFAMPVRMLSPFLQANGVYPIEPSAGNTGRSGSHYSVRVDCLR